MHVGDLDVVPGDTGGEAARALLRRVTAELGPAQPGAGPRLPCRIEVHAGGPGPESPQGYRLDVAGDLARIRARGPAGAFYGACTLAQLLRLAPCRGGVRELPAVTVEDAPDFERRGVLLDVSRDRVPRMDELLELVEALARLKVNELQLYCEHVFAYPGHERVWRDASPFDADEIRRLDAFCRERHVELVPNQQSLGHLHRWLVHAPYRALAECPDGVDHPFSLEREPFSLCPTDLASTEFLAGLYDELLPAFSSARCNVDLDETFDIGLGRSAAACRQRGRGRVYLDFLNGVHRLLAERGRAMQYWGDVVLEHPELVPELPRDALALCWGYEAGHPFARDLGRFAESGVEFCVCPGTSAWQSLGGRLANAAHNLAEAAAAGRAAGARGYLVTDWGDHGHWQPPIVSWPGYLLGAARAWNVDASPAPLAELVAAHVLDDPSGVAARVLVGLGELGELPGVRATNGSPLFFLLRFAHEGLPHPRLEGLGVEALVHAQDRLDELGRVLADQRMRRPDAGAVEAELRWVLAAAGFAAELGRARLGGVPGAPLGALPPRVRRGLRERLVELVAEHRRCWLARSRPGGLDDSCARLWRVGRALGGDVSGLEKDRDCP